MSQGTKDSSIGIERHILRSSSALDGMIQYLRCLIDQRWREWTCSLPQTIGLPVHAQCESDRISISTFIFVILLTRVVGCTVLGARQLPLEQAQKEWAYRRSHVLAVIGASNGCDIGRE
jgi:hypothetical protein